MNMEVAKDRSEGESPLETSTDASEEKQPSLNDETTQDEYRKAYLEQLRRQSCLGCGETDIF